MVLRKLVSLSVPASVALLAFLHARAIGALVDVSATPASIAPFANARPAAATARAPEPRSAAAILDRNPFDHVTGSLRALYGGAPGSEDPTDPTSAPQCEGVRAVASVRAEDVDASFAALDVRGKGVLQKRGGDVADLRVVYVAADRVWLERNGVLCQAPVFASRPSTPPAPVAVAGIPLEQTALEKDVARKIERTGPTEFQIDRGVVDRILDAQAELMKTPLVPEKDGDRVTGFRLIRIRPGSVLATLGLESNDRLVSINGIEVTSTERMLEAYARLRSGTLDRLTIHVVRQGKPTNIDYVVR